MSNKTPAQNVGIAVCQIDLAGEALSEIQLTPDGQFRAKDGRPHGLSGWHIDATSAAALHANFAAVSDKRVIDYDHATLYTKETGNKAPAAGWFGKIEHRPGKGLMALGVEWTAEARADIEAKKYRYISPVIAYDKATGTVTNVLMAALTNFPALDGMDDLTARAAAHFNFPTTSETPPVDKETLALLGLAENAAPEAITQAIAGLKAQADKAQTQETEIAALKAQSFDPAKFVPVAAVTELQSQLAALSAQMEGDRLQKLIDSNPAKLPTPQLQAWAKTLSFEALSAYLVNAPEINALNGMQTGGKEPGAPAAPMTVKALAAEWQGSAALQAEFLSADDYAAFKRAEINGQVKIQGAK